MCEVLPSLHALTGCDSASAFATKEEKKAFDIVHLDPSLKQIVGSLGERVPASYEDLNKIKQFVCALYNDHRCNSVNELRYNQRPPTKAALKNHLRRANYKAFLWRHALETQMDQAPDGHGWQLKKGQLKIYWTNQAPAP